MRPDGRDALQLRAMACETKTLSMLDGSARYSHQGSCVLASVTGPIEAGANKQGERAHVQVTITGCSMDDGTRERALQWHLRNVVDSCVACELHPYCIIAVNVQVISEDGSIESTIFNAVLCALLHAGIPLHRSFVSVTVAMCNGHWVIDPLASEESSCSCRVTLVTDAAVFGAMALLQSGCCDETHVNDGVRLGTQACKTIGGFVRMNVAHSVKLQAIWSQQQPQ